MIFREILGTAASLLVMLSYMVDGIKLRIINIIGSIVFVIYGIMLGGISIIVLNSVTIFIHLYYILKEVKGDGRKIKRTRKDS